MIAEEIKSIYSQIIKINERLATFLGKQSIHKNLFYLCLPSISWKEI